MVDDMADNHTQKYTKVRGEFSNTVFGMLIDIDINRMCKENLNCILGLLG
jgi:hypothetical protein